MSLKARQSTQCILCGETGNVLYKQLTDRLHDVPGEYEIYYCNACKLAWLSPIPFKEDVVKCYADEYYTHSPVLLDEEPSTKSSLKDVIRRAILNQWYGYKYPDVSGKIHSLIGKILGVIPFLRSKAYYDMKIGLPWKEGGRLLDVGCGNGGYLLMMRKLGWQVEGIDIDPQAVMAASKNHLTVHIGFLEDHSFPSESFDVITMSHVIEHLIDPHQTIKECHRVLKPGGYLAVVTPNFDSLLHRYFGKSYIALDPPRHTFIFTLRSIKKIISESGFEIRVLKTIVDKHMFDFCYSMSYQIRKNGKCKYDVSDGHSSFEKTILKTIEAISHPFLQNGEEIVLIAQKKS